MGLAFQKLNNHTQTVANQQLQAIKAIAENNNQPDLWKRANELYPDYIIVPFEKSWRWRGTESDNILTDNDAIYFGKVTFSGRISYRASGNRYDDLTFSLVTGGVVHHYQSFSNVVPETGFIRVNGEFNGSFNKIQYLGVNGSTTNDIMWLHFSGYKLVPARILQVYNSTDQPVQVVFSKSLGDWVNYVTHNLVVGSQRLKVPMDYIIFKNFTVLSHVTFKWNGGATMQTFPNTSVGQELTMNIGTSFIVIDPVEQESY